MINTVLSIISLKFPKSFCSVFSSNELLDSSKIKIGLSEKVARAMAVRCIYPSESP